jgi:cytochrome P450
MSGGAPARAVGQTLPAQTPPGIAGLGRIGQTLAFLRDPLACLDRCAQQRSDVVFLRVGMYPVVVPVTADLVNEVLVTRHADFPKVQVSEREPARVVFGQGLSLTEGDAWVRQRRLVQPAFSRKAFAGYEERFLVHARATRDRWSDGGIQSVDHDMMEVSLRIAVDTLLGTSLPENVERIRHLIRVCLGNITAFNSLVENVLPPWIPTLRRRRFRRAVAELDAILFDIIARRRGSPGGEDLLSLLIHAAAAEDGTMTDRQLRDEAMTMFVAGHETTAVALSWAFLLLAQHPEAQSQLHRELDDVVGDRELTVEDLHRLPFTEAVIKEALRLYPPAYVYARQVREDVELGGYRIPNKSLVLSSPWLVQRDARSFPEPMAFQPERMMGEREKALPKGAYIPFGFGPRKCVGQAFAISESVAVLAAVAQRYRVELVDPVVRRDVAMTLRPKRLRLRSVARRGA